jgi:choline monooxygenase
MVIHPRSPALTEERLHLYFVGDVATAADYDATRAGIIERWRAINLEDIGITERLQRGRASPGFDGGASRMVARSMAAD